MEFQGTERYYLDPELGAIVNMAIAMEKPLLLTGEAGTGKTQLAFEISRSLGYPLEGLRCKSTLTGEEGSYAPERLAPARPGSPSRSAARWGIRSRSCAANRRSRARRPATSRTPCCA